MIRYLSLTMCLGLLATGCQSTSPTACAPGQKPPKAPLGQRLFGTTQKPSNCPTCPPPGALPGPGPQPPVLGAQPPAFSPPPVGAGPAYPGNASGMAPPAFQNGPGLGMNPPPIGASGPGLGMAPPPPAPVTANKVPVPSTIILGPPETTPTPTQTRSAGSASSFPVDIPGYAVLADKIAGGQQPFPDGINWLKEAGFSTVIQLRQPSEDISACRQLVERQNMTYKSLEVSAQSLDATLLAALDRDIQAANGRPVFLFDRDGTRTGAIWIAYATRYLTLSETQAREQAARLGYRRENADPAWEQAISRLSNSR